MTFQGKFKTIKIEKSRKKFDRYNIENLISKQELGHFLPALFLP